MMFSGPITISLVDIKKEETWAPIVEAVGAAKLVFYPPQLLRFVESKAFKTCNLTNVKMILCGGGPVTPAMHARVKDLFNEHHPHKSSCGKSPFPVIKQMYGSTEMGPGTFLTPFSTDPKIYIESVGVPPPNTGNKYQIRDVTTGELCKTGEHGEIEVRTTMRMFNYYHKLEEGQIDWVSVIILNYLF